MNVRSAFSPILASAALSAWLSLFLSAYVAHSLSLSLCLSPPLCPWGPSPFILTPRAITISVVTAGHVTCTCSSGWSPHAGAIWSHTCTRTNTHFSWLPSPLSSSWHSHGLTSLPSLHHFDSFSSARLTSIFPFPVCFSPLNLLFCINWFLNHQLYATF